MREERSEKNTKPITHSLVDKKDRERMKGFGGHTSYLTDWAVETDLVWCHFKSTWQIECWPLQSRNTTTGSPFICLLHASEKYDSQAESTGVRGSFFLFDPSEFEVLSSTNFSVVDGWVPEKVIFPYLSITLILLLPVFILNESSARHSWLDFLMTFKCKYLFPDSVTCSWHEKTPQLLSTGRALNTAKSWARQRKLALPHFLD